MKISIEVNAYDCDSIDNAIALLRALPWYTPDAPDVSLLDGPQGILAHPGRFTQIAAEIGDAVFPPPAPAPAASEADAIAALQAFVKAQGVPAAVAVLQQFGVARVTELSADDRATFIAQVQAA